MGWSGMVRPCQSESQHLCLHSVSSWRLSCIECF